MPKPRDGENRAEFIDRCMSDPEEQRLRPDPDARLARCMGIWESERAMSPNEKLLKAIRERGEKQAPFSEGILTADRYVKTLRECVGSDLCYRYAASEETSFDDLLRKAARTLTYRNPDMELVGEPILTASESTKAVSGDLEIELPKNTLMVFRHVLTTPRKDRDGDVLRTEGAVVDPKMLLLWQHVHTLPIGKMLAIASHDSKRLELVSAIIDLNELCHDAAVMVDNGMARFSHGFRALEFEQLKEEDGRTTSPGGFDVKRFEIMEESLVSVPSNKDAEVEEVILSLVEGDKLTSGMMREYGRAIRERRPKRVAGVEIPKGGKGADDEEQRAGEAAGAGGACGCGGGKQAGAPEQKDGAASGEGQAAVRSEDSEVKNGGTLLDGSWEQVQRRLCDQARRYLLRSGIGSEWDHFYLLATYPDRVVVCCEKMEYGVADEYRYFEIDWELRDGRPELTGDPRQVEIVTTAEMRERSPLWEAKRASQRGAEVEIVTGLELDDKTGALTIRKQVVRFTKDGEMILDEKAGARLSRANREKLVDVRDDLAEMHEREEGLSRAGRAQCKGCLTKLDEVIGDEGEPDGETSAAEMTAKRAAAEFLTRANREERAELEDGLRSLREREQQNKKRARLRKLLGR